MEKVTALDGAKIADAVYDFANIADYEIAKDKNGNPISYNDPAIGLQLALYENSATAEKDYVIAVRGTEPFAFDGDMQTNVRMFVSIYIYTPVNESPLFKSLSK